MTLAYASCSDGTSISKTIANAADRFDVAARFAELSTKRDDLHIDAAVEDMRDSPNEVAVPLTTGGAGTPVKGRRYIADFTYNM